ncbi:MFS general substrate transporter [Xylariaceae sp. AK1471]|nr:MFS general substrate transporter [Xylariaceae sp. AK1471]
MDVTPDHEVHDDEPSSPRINLKPSQNGQNGQNGQNATERSPLLGDVSEQQVPVNAGSESESDGDVPAPKTSHAIIFKICVIVAIAATGDSLIESPQMRIFESIICYRYYEHADPSKLLLGRDQLGPGALGGVAEEWCKVNQVQADLAALKGYQLFLDGIPALLLGVPFGLAADRFGRKPILMLGLFSLLLRDAWIQLVTWVWQEFDVRMSWLSTLHGLMGGGSIVLVGFLFVMVNDVTLDRYRANIFMRAGAASLVANLLIPPLASRLMIWDPWIPCLLGILARLVCCVLMFSLPETLGFRSSSEGPRRPPKQNVTSRSTSSESIQPKAPNLLTRSVRLVQRAIIVLTSNARIMFLIMVFAGHSILGSTFSILLQYSSKRYHLTLSTATLLITIFNAVRVAMLLLIVPLLVTAVKNMFHFSEEKKDLYICRVAFMFVFVGWSLIALSPNIPLFIMSLVIAAAGTAPAYLILRSYLSSLIPAEHTARVYSATSILDTLGSMIGAALIPNLFEKGMDLGGGWIGLPFLFLGLIGLFSALVLFCNKPTISRPDEE